MSSPSQRLVSLDVFRGATIAGMMLVNNPGDWGHIYAPWKHRPWDGWTYTDTVFPFFLWIVGVAMMLSFAKRIQKGATPRELAGHVLWRAAVIFFLGLFLAGVPHLSLFFFWVAAIAYTLLQIRKWVTIPPARSMVWVYGAIGIFIALIPIIAPNLVQTAGLNSIRIPGVLQRIAVCYLLGGMLMLYTSTLTQMIVTIVLLVGYWLAIAFIPVPGYGAGVWEAPGNLAWYIDSNLLVGHTWRGAPVKGFDPEGIFSTIPAIATVMFGAFTGLFLGSKRSRDEKTAWMFFAGSLLILTGLIMDNWLPINKPLWSSTYTVFMAGLALVVFSCCFWVLDVQGWRRGSKFFEIYGQNAITMFVLAGVFGRLFSMRLFGAETSFKGWYYPAVFEALFPDPYLASFAHSVAFMLFLYAIAYVMYKKNWIIKV